MHTQTAPAFRAASRTAAGVRLRVACGVLCGLTAALAPAAGATTFEAALLDFKSGRDKNGMAKLEQLAVQGDARAQYFLGLELVKGTSGPVDLTRGYAWLKIAAEPYLGSYGSSAVDDARAAAAKIGPLLSGQNLIRADQIAGSFLGEQNAAAQAQLNRALEALVATNPVAAAGRRQGCAADRSLKGCPPAPADEAAPTCAGNFVTPDTEPSTRGPDAIIKKPVYPSAARRTAEEGRVVYLAHIDRSGDICHVVIAMSSGDDDIDRAALEAVRTWRLQPGLKDGEPVEVVDNGKIEFGLSDFRVDQR